MRIVVTVAVISEDIVGTDRALPLKVAENTAVLRGIGNFENASRGTPERVYSV